MPSDDRLEKIIALVGPVEMSDDEEHGEVRSVIEKIQSALTTAGGVFSPFLVVYSAFSAAFNTADRDHRVTTAVIALCDELYSVWKSLPTNAEEALKSKWFRKAVRVVMEEAVRADDDDQAAMLALVAVHGCFPNGMDKHRQEDLAAYLRDLTKLGIEDVRMLRLICEHYAPQVEKASNLNYPDQFADGFNGFRGLLDKNGIHPDDGVSLGARLGGLGLAFEVTRNPNHQGANDTWFRPTRRGLYLLSLLKNAEASMSARTQDRSGA